MAPSHATLFLVSLPVQQQWGGGDLFVTRGQTGNLTTAACAAGSLPVMISPVHSNSHHRRAPRIGVLLCSLGTPDAPTWRAVYRFLVEFLSDPRVVEMPRLLWWVMLRVILLFRCGKSAALYRTVWQDAGSPLRINAEKQASAVQRFLDKKHPNLFEVFVAMRYGNPSITQALNKFKASKVSSLLVLPLFPQYSSTTTASVFEASFRALRRWRALPHMRLVANYHDHPDYIAALSRTILKKRTEAPLIERVLFSFHGIPKAYSLAGDPYQSQCQETAQRVALQSRLADSDWLLTFQSRFGPRPWLTPYTDQTLLQLARDGIRHVAVICPGFSTDCLETLEEINQQNRRLFLKAGGESFHYIPALNDQPDHIALLSHIIEQQTTGWHQQEEHALRE